MNDRGTPNYEVATRRFGNQRVLENARKRRGELEKIAREGRTAKERGEALDALMALETRMMEEVESVKAARTPRFPTSAEVEASS